MLTVAGAHLLNAAWRAHMQAHGCGREHVAAGRRLERDRALPSLPLSLELIEAAAYSIGCGLQPLTKLRDE